MRCDLGDEYSGLVHAGHVLNDPLEFEGGTATVENGDIAQAIARRHTHVHYDGELNESVAPFDPSSMTVSDLRERLEADSLSEKEIASLKKAEKEGKDRETALDVISGY